MAINPLSISNKEVADSQVAAHMGRGDTTNAVRTSIEDPFPTIGTVHSRIHAGQGFTYSSKVNVLTAANLDFLLINPAANYPHLRKFVFTVTGAPCDIYLYEGTTVSANGTAKTWTNSNRASVNTASLGLYEGPTVTGVGTQIEYVMLPTTDKHGQSGSSVDDIGIEWVLNPSTNYLLRLTNGSGGAIDVGTYLFMYERES